MDADVAESLDDYDFFTRMLKLRCLKEPCFGI